jgi:RNA polymerase sigma-70 factor (ECF subfamily)
LRAWLFTIMHNQHVNSLRRSARQGHFVDLDRANMATPPVQLGKLIVRDLDKAMVALPREQRVALVLVAVRGMKYEAAAAACGLPVGTIRSRLSRARDAVRTMLDGRESSLTDARPNSSRSDECRQVAPPAAACLRMKRAIE